MAANNPITAGDKFGSLTFVRRLTTCYGEFQCICGGVRKYNMSLVQQGKLKSCGCRWKREPILIVAVGQRFGYLTILSEGRNLRGKRSALCRCDCGVEKSVNITSLFATAATRSCGASIHSKNRTHGRAKTRIYGVWLSMRRRCNDQKNKRYSNYGARGISVCDRWQSSFENFATDMGMRPHGTTLDRINTDGNYEPSNCRWASWTEQQRNRRNNICVTLNGKTQTLVASAEELGIDSGLAHSRYYAGWKPEELFLAPLVPHGRENGSFKHKVF